LIHVKPIVHYRPHRLDKIEEGLPAILVAGTLDHWRLKNDGCMVVTTDVLRIEGGSHPPAFETLNHWYFPAKQQ